MIRYAGERLALGVLVVVGVVVLTFLIARVIPGDPAVTYAGPRASKAQLEQTRRQLGLDKPVVVQLGDYLKGIATGDWGTSYRTKRPVLSDLRTALPASIELVTAGLLLALLVGLPLGLVSARFHGELPDFLVRIVSVIGVSMPVFWAALILQLVFAQRLGWLPAAGEYDPNLYYSSPLTSYVQMPAVDALITGNVPVLESSISHLILPAAVVALYPAGLLARMVRASVLDTLGESHIRMTRSLGFGDRAIFGRWALRPAMNPVVQVTALVFAYSLANTFLVEAVFDWPGLGSYAANSLQALDTPAIVGVTLIVAIVYVVLNLLVDIARIVPSRGFARRNPTLVAGAVLLGLILLAALLAPWLAPDPADAGTATHPFRVLAAPSSAHPFGTDLVGRDLLTRVMYGARISLRIVVEVLLIAGLVGIPLGLAAGYFGGHVDQVIMRITDVFLAFPALLLSLAIAFVLTPSVTNMTIAIAVTWWPWYTRLVRGEAASVATRPYIESCRTLGVSPVRILLRHVLPNSITPVLVQMSMDAGGILLTAASISFLGLGAQDPTPEWGLIVSQGAQYFSTQWWFVTFAGLAILLTAVAFNLIGDGVRELLDPRRVISR